MARVRVVKFHVTRVNNQTGFHTVCEIHSESEMREIPDSDVRDGVMIIDMQSAPRRRVAGTVR